MNVKRFIFSWHIWVIVALVAAIFFFGREKIGVLLPLAVVLLCPIMMLFMMNDKNHKQ